jgi:hypothetical protein
MPLPDICSITFKPKVSQWLQSSVRTWLELLADRRHSHDVSFHGYSRRSQSPGLESVRVQCGPAQQLCDAANAPSSAVGIRSSVLNVG